MGKISVVIPTYNRGNLLKETIDSVLRQTVRPDEIIIVDDGSTDNTKQIIAESYGESIIYVYQENKGAAAARNLGIKKSSGEVIAFLDSDCIADKEWLAGLMKGFMGDDIGVVTGGKSSYPATNIIEQFSSLYDDVPNGSFAEHSFMPFPNTGNMAVKRIVIEQVGTFDVSFPWCEDNEFGWRMGMDSKFKIAFARDAVVYHKHRSTLRGLLRQKRNYGYGKVLLYRKFKSYRKNILQDILELVLGLVICLLRSFARWVKIIFRKKKEWIYVAEHYLHMLCMFSRFVGIVQGRIKYKQWF